jgi:hypothetical protein
MRWLLAATCAVLSLVPLMAPASASASLLPALTGSGGLLTQLGYTLSDVYDGLIYGKTALTASSCPTVTTSEPFAPFGDHNEYFLVPGGSFTSTPAGWGLRGASASNGVLTLAPGGTAVTSKFCVGAQDPTFRLFIRSRGTGLALMTVSALFVDLGGNLRSQTVAMFSSTGGAVRLSPIEFLSVNYRAGHGNMTAIALQFTANGGTWDVAAPYIDPFRSN